jgi:hypothetical protein
MGRPGRPAAAADFPAAFSVSRAAHFTAQITAVRRMSGIPVTAH